MAEFEPRTGGALFSNAEYQKKNKKAPDYTGMLTITREDLRTFAELMDGDTMELNLAGWMKESKSKKKYMSLAVSYREKKEDSGSKEEEKFSKPEPNDEIPF